jgi:hypothetical protein
MSFKDWLNGTSMTSFRSFVLVIITSIILIYFSVLAGIMLIHDAPSALIMSKDPAIRAAAQTTESSHHNFGYQIVTAILQLIGLALGINAASAFGDRVTAKEHSEAKERGKIAGAAIAASMGATNGHTTKEHPAPKVQINTEIKGDEQS